MLLKKAKIYLLQSIIFKGGYFMKPLKDYILHTHFCLIGRNIIFMGIIEEKLSDIKIIGAEKLLKNL